MKEDILQDDRLVVLLVMRGIHERERLVAGNLPKLIDEYRLVLEFGPVATLKLLPSRGVVSEPVS